MHRHDDEDEFDRIFRETHGDIEGWEDEDDDIEELGGHGSWGKTSSFRDEDDDGGWAYDDDDDDDENDGFSEIDNIDGSNLDDDY